VCIPRSQAAGCRFHYGALFSTLLFLFGIFSTPACAADPPAAWRLALPGWPYEFPRDHQPHPDFKTEWWYFTGNLHDSAGRPFGYQVTFFRQGIRPPGVRAGTTSRLLVNDLPFAHSCISDPQGKRFLFQQRISRGVLGQSGFGEGERLAWIDDWSLLLHKDQTFHLQAANDETSLTLDLSNARSSWVIHGQNGVSQKAAGEGHASHYYSGTRMRSTGSLVLGGKRFQVEGESWFDHEWATNQLTPEQAGWNWFSVQLEDGTELMLYQMRLKSGGIDPASSGTFVAADGQARHLVRDDYRLTPLRFWTSAKTHARYPAAWRIEVPALYLDLEVETPLPDQELALPSISYWEGMIDLKGNRDGHPVKGHGYMELTGYAGALTGLSSR